MSGELLRRTVTAIGPASAAAVEEARQRQDRLTKPSGSLGALEDVSVRLSGLARSCPPPLPAPAAVAVFAGDHGVHAQGVSPWPQEVTAQMVANFLGGGAAVNALAAQAGADVVVIDVGVATPIPGVATSPVSPAGAGTGEAAAGDATADGDRQARTFLDRRVRPGTADLASGPAMAVEEAVAALEVGIAVAEQLVDDGYRCLLTGDMGIANTTASAALIAAFTGASPDKVTGRGTGVDEATWRRKVGVVRHALHLHRPDPADPAGVLAAVGGLEHAAIAGLVLGAAARRVPVVLDGVIAGSAALVAAALAPSCVDACVAGHRSVEPGHAVVLDRLGMVPLVDLQLRLGEGTGALLALPLVQAAVRALREMATFDAAGVADKQG
jgi:nicotinate-nucleotide--dimethylbenzimidazole phosphoribosyltransferase